MSESMREKYGTRPREQILAEQESAALLPPALQALLDAARAERIASEAQVRAGGTVAPAGTAPTIEGGAK
jgi:hypothetical protein